MNNVSIQDFDIEGFEGKEKCKIDVFPLADNTPISLPCGIISSGNGVRVCIVSGQHGNEWNGIYVAQSLFKDISPERVEGTIVILPILNPPAFNEKSRVSSIDKIDLNRTFSRNPPIKPTDHLGKMIFEKILSKMDCLIDIHGGGPGEYAPHVAIVNEDWLDEASKLLIPDIYIETKTPGSLAATCYDANIPCLTIEAGVQREIKPEYVTMINKGLRNFLTGKKIIRGKYREIDRHIYRGKKKIPSPTSGFFKPEIDLGRQIKKGEKIGTVEKLFGGKKTIKSPVSGKVLYLRKEKVVSYGENLAHINW